jgi:hypothetical protein
MPLNTCFSTDYANALRVYMNVALLRTPHAIIIQRSSARIKYVFAAPYYFAQPSFTSRLAPCFRPRVTVVPFTGKGYYAFANGRGALAPRFGYGHRLRLFDACTLIFRAAKYRYTFLTVGTSPS